MELEDLTAIARTSLPVALGSVPPDPRQLDPLYVGGPSVWVGTERQWVDGEIPGEGAFIRGGRIIDEQTAFQVGVVWACIDIQARTVAASDWYIMQRTGRKRSQELWDDPLTKILNLRPNADMSAMSFRRALAIAMLSWGNGYAEILRDGSNRIVGLYPIHPGRVTPFREEGSVELTYRIENQGAATGFIRASEMIHVKGPSIVGLMGVNKIGLAAGAIALTIATNEFASSYFNNGGRPGGVLEYPQRLDDPQFEELRKRWANRHEGPEKAFKTAILDGGLKYTSIPNDAQKGQTVESRQFQIEEICFVPGTNIVTPGGICKIEDVEVGQLVLTHLGRWRKVRSVMRRAYDGDVVTLEAKGLDTVTCTPNHPFYCQEMKKDRHGACGPVSELGFVDAANLRAAGRSASGGKRRSAYSALTIPKKNHDFQITNLDMTEWCDRAKAVFDGDDVFESSNHRATPITRTPRAGWALGYLIGIYASDGSVSDHQTVIYLGAHEAKAAELVHKCLRECFGVAASSTITNGNVNRIVISNRILARFFADIGRSCYTKALPWWVMAGTDELIEGIIAGIIDGDGCVSKEYISVKITSINLAWQIRLLMWSKGVHAYMTTYKPGEVTFRDTTYSTAETYLVGWRKTKVRRGIMGDAGSVNVFDLNNKTISQYSGVVYNLEVEEDESYTTTGGCVHNCRWWGVPPHKVQHLNKASENSIEDQGKAFVNDCLRPTAREFQQEFDAKCLNKRTGYYYSKIDLDWVQEGTFKERMEGLREARNTGVLNANEIRDEIGFDDMGPDGDRYIVQGAMIDLRDVGLPYKQKADAAAAPSTGKDAQTEVVKAWLSNAFARSVRCVEARQIDNRRNGHNQDSAKALALAHGTEYLQKQLVDVWPFLVESGVADDALRMGKEVLSGRPIPEAMLMIFGAPREKSTRPPDKSSRAAV